MSRARRYDSKADVGVTATQLHVERQLGWIFRDQRKNDFGIDAHVEICDGDEPTGRLVGLQVKTGASYFRERVAGGWVFRFGDKHRSYWLFGSLPVIVILFDDAEGVGYWEVVTDATSERTGKGWKLLVPETNTLGRGLDRAMLALSEGPEWLQRFRQLALARDWMETLRAGEELVVEFTDKVNTVTPRGSFSIWRGGERLEDWPFYVRGHRDHSEILDHAFPWAAAALDEDHHARKIEDLWEAECGYGDGEGGSYHTVPLEDFAVRFEGMDPDEWMGNEFSTSRYRLELNDFGESFLRVYDHLHGRPSPAGSRSRPVSADIEEEGWTEPDPEQEKRQFVRRARQFGFQQLKDEARCTVRLPNFDDENAETELECGSSTPPGEGFARWEREEKREVVWCWSCLSEILWAGP